jgi:starch synthase
MKVLFLSSEVAPFAKTGGLADVAGTLPSILANKGLKIIIIMPKYRGIKGEQSKLGKAKVYFVENDAYFDREYLYGGPQGDYVDNLKRFAFYCRQTLQLTKKINFRPDIIHCNDWQTALIPIYLKTIEKQDAFFEDSKTIFTIHNLAYQGLFPSVQLPLTGLSNDVLGNGALEYYGKINLMKGGLIFSDILSTVSPTYAREIQTKEYGCGLEKILFKRRKDLFGILNGIDYSDWNPETDKYIYENYSIKTLSKKKNNKVALQKEIGLLIDKDKPLLGMISRLVHQKGLDLLIDIIEPLLQKGIQFVLLGTGEKKYQNMFSSIAKKYNRCASINLKFDAVLANKIYTGVDIFLMPSRYEPCGLGQLISMKYGTIPVVRATGGLADTVIDFDENSKKGTGFTFKQPSSGDFLKAIQRALRLYQNQKKWNNLMKRIMKLDFSWDKSSDRYIDLYKKTLSRK